jgi:hypothetical protein
MVTAEGGMQEKAARREGVRERRADRHHDSESVRDIERSKPAQTFGCKITNGNIPVNERN